MDLINNIGNIRNIWGNSNTKITNLTHTKILEIGKALNTISNDIKLENNCLTPSLVVVGSQSSGKSSVLNGILSMDLLPTGKSMVTRTPLNLDLIQTETDMYAEFGCYNNTKWIQEKIVKLTNPLPTEEEINLIHEEIKQQTIRKAGAQMDISELEINLKIYSPFVPNINLIDLPGLTMVACTDKGQPENIKQKIRNLIIKYIKEPKNIILSVMPAREDLEADVALDLCKEFDKNGDRTIGILTKIDLMNKGNSVINYLNNNISKDLILKYGYYAVKNRNKAEMTTKNIKEGIEDEISYFKLNLNYNCVNDRCGIINLSKKVSQILFNNIKEQIPEILKQISGLRYQNDNLLSSLGEPVPTTNESKQSLMNNIVNILTTEYSSNINKRGSEINTGRNLKDTFINYRHELLNISPFSENICSNQYLQDIIDNCEGNHMSFSTPTIEILENCLNDIKISPFNKLLPLSIECVKQITKELIKLIDILLKNNFITRFPKLVNSLNDSIVNDVLLKNQKITINKLEEIINMEKNYIWTDDNKFLESLKSIKIDNNKNVNINHLRTLCNEYLNSVKYILQHSIPKCIMYFLVQKTQKELRILLFEKTNKKEYLDFLVEDKTINEKREKYNVYRKKLNEAQKILETF